MDTYRTKLYYYTFFKKFFNKFILPNRLKKVWFLDVRYKKKDLDFQDKKLDERQYYYNLDRCKNKKIIIMGKLP